MSNETPNFSRNLGAIDHKRIESRYNALVGLNTIFESYGTDMEPNKGLVLAANNIGRDIRRCARDLGATPREIFHDVLPKFGLGGKKNE